jgi:hypothetical protein
MKEKHNDICGLLRYYATSCGNCLPTFRDNVLIPSSRIKSPTMLTARWGEISALKGTHVTTNKQNS